MKDKMRILQYDAIVGFVDYGSVEYDDSEELLTYITTMRCKLCGAAWIAENYRFGYEVCPNCFKNKVDKGIPVIVK